MSKWVLLLGGSTGHGAATAKKLASEGYGIIAFHFDRGEAKKIANDTIQEVKSISKDQIKILLFEDIVKSPQETLEDTRIYRLAFC